MSEQLSEEQIADLEGKMKQLHIFNQHEEDIERLKKNDKEIILDLEGLKEGQENLKKDVEVGFEKGRKRMDGMEEEMREIKGLILQSNNDRDRQHGEVKDEIRNDKMKRLEDKLDKKDEELKNETEFKDKVKYGAMYLAGGTMLSYILWTLTHQGGQ